MAVTTFERYSPVPTEPSREPSVRCDADDPSRIVLSGDVEGTSALRLRDALSTAVRQAVSRIVVDVSRVRTMDMAALRALIAGRRLAAAAGVDLVLRQPSADVVTLLAATGLSHAFTVSAAPSAPVG